MCPKLCTLSAFTGSFPRQLPWTTCDKCLQWRRSLPGLVNQRHHLLRCVISLPHIQTHPLVPEGLLSYEIRNGTLTRKHGGPVVKSSAFNNENINRSLQSVVPQQLAGSWASHGRIIGACQQTPVVPQWSKAETDDCFGSPTWVWDRRLQLKSGKLISNILNNDQRGYVCLYYVCHKSKIWHQGIHRTEMTQSIEQQGDSLVDLLAHTSCMYHTEWKRAREVEWQWHTSCSEHFHSSLSTITMLPTGWETKTNKEKSNNKPIKWIGKCCQIKKEIFPAPQLMFTALLKWI